mgnify:CR=1 FL=1
MAIEVKNDLSQMIAALTNEYRTAAIKYVEYLSQAQKANAKATLHDIQKMFAEEKGWTSESEMLEDMAQFRRERLSKCAY